MRTRDKQLLKTNKLALNSQQLNIATQGARFNWTSYWLTRFPSAISLLIVNATRIDLFWTNNGTQDFTGISIERSTDGVNYTQIDTVNPNVATYSNTGLSADTHYYYKVRYYKGSKYSAYTSVVDVDNSFMTGILNQFRFEEDSGNAIDDINGNNGVPTPGTTQGVTGLIGKAISFDGSHTISLSNTHSFLLTDNITVSFWFKPTTIIGIKTLIREVTANNYKFRVLQDGQNISFQFAVPGASATVVFTLGTPLANYWYHVLVERNVSTDKINVEVNNLAWSTPVTDATNNTWTNALLFGLSYTGLFDELKLWKRLLSPTEKLNLHNYGRNSLAGRFDNGKLLITFDDSTTSQYSVGFPLLVAQGVKGTFYTISGQVGVAGFVTWANLQEMYAAGMDIQCHSDNGDSLTMTKEEIIVKLQNVNDDFIANDLPVPLHHAYPGGSHNATSISALRDSGLRLTGRAVGPYALVRLDIDKYDDLNSYAIDNIDAAGVTALQGVMDIVKFQKGALIIYAHGVSELGGTYEVSSANLNTIIDYAQSIGMDILTISELYELLNP